MIAITVTYILITAEKGGFYIHEGAKSLKNLLGREKHIIRLRISFSSSSSFFVGVLRIVTTVF
jgi:predicted transcriptional regulator